MCLCLKSFSNEIDETDCQFEKHDEQKTSQPRIILIDVIGWCSRQCADEADSQVGSQRERGRTPMT
jgi:hypothetical protein